MKQTLLPIFLVFLLFSCAKNVEPVSTLNGIWVEQSLRLDTLNFEIAESLGLQDGYSPFGLRGNSFIDSSNIRYPLINSSSIYTYYLASESIYLRNIVLSFPTFQQYKFEMADNQQTFKIEKFYKRYSLPATLIFVKIK